MHSDAAGAGRRQPAKAAEHVSGIGTLTHRKDAEVELALKLVAAFGRVLRGGEYYVVGP